jgi:hypothetical protein
MRKTIITLLLINLLTACSPGSRAGGNPTQIPASPLPQISQSPAVSFTQTNVPGSTHSATPRESESILEDFPLAVNAIWKYSAEISYQVPEKVGEIETWTGTITDHVIGMEKLADGRQVYKIEETLEPLPPQTVWRQPGSYDYIISDDEIYKGDRKVYQWPLSDGMSWDYIPGYLTRVDYIGGFDSQSFDLQDCYTLSIITNADTTIDTFCSQIGFVEHVYRHHGTPQDEHFILQDYLPGE